MPSPDETPEERKRRLARDRKRAQRAREKAALEASRRGTVSTPPPSAQAFRQDASSRIGAEEWRERLWRACRYLPTPAHGAFLRLAVAGVISRWHLWQQWDDEWMGYVVAGPPKAGKSFLGTALRTVFGLPKSVVRRADVETVASLFGRRYSAGKGKYPLARPVEQSWPLLWVDELDKANSDVERGLLRLLQGETLVAGEDGEMVEYRPTVLVSYNGNPTRLPPGYGRRSILFAPWRTPRIREQIKTFMAVLPPAIDLDRLKVPTVAPDGLAEALLDELRELLTDEGEGRLNEAGIERLLLGYAAQGLDWDTAAACLFDDYLACADTVGELYEEPEPEAEPFESNYSRNGTSPFVHGTVYEPAPTQAAPAWWDMPTVPVNGNGKRETLWQRLERLGFTPGSRPNYAAPRGTAPAGRDTSVSAADSWHDDPAPIVEAPRPR